MNSYASPIGGKPPGGPIPPSGYYPPPRRRFGLWLVVLFLFGLLFLSMLSNLGYYLESTSGAGVGSGVRRAMDEAVTENNDSENKILIEN